MRTLVVAGMLALTVVSVGHGQVPLDPRSTLDLLRNEAHTVTISRAGVTVATLVIAQDAEANVTYDRDNASVATGYFYTSVPRSTFRGNVELRVMAVGAPLPYQRNGRAPEWAVELKATGVEVQIEPR